MLPGVLIVVCGCTVVYRRWRLIRAWLRRQWRALESALCEELARAMGRSLLLEVSIEELELRARGITLRKVGMEKNEEEGSKCVAMISSLEFRTSGALGLASLGGICWVGTPRHPFCAGFTAREVDAIVMTGVRVEVYEIHRGKTRGRSRSSDHGESLAARRSTLFRPNAFVSLLKTKAVVDQYSRTAREHKIQKRIKFAENFIRRWRVDDEGDVRAAILREKPDATWRIGRFEILDMSVDLYGHHLHLNKWQTSGFVGDTAELQFKVGFNVLQGMIGPRHAYKQIHDDIANNVKIAKRDAENLAKSAKHDISHFHLRREVGSFMFKHPERKGLHPDAPRTTLAKIRRRTTAP